MIVKHDEIKEREKTTKSIFQIIQNLFSLE